MSWVTVIWSMGASACLTLAAMYFVVWWKNRTTQAHLLFALTAASTAVFAFFELSIMRAQTPQQLDAALRWAQVPASLGLLALTWLVWIYLDAGRRWLAWTICGLCVLLALPNLLSGGHTTFREIPGLERIQFLGESVSVISGIPNPLGVLGWITVALILVFVADTSLTVWRRGDRRRALIVGGSVEFVLFTGLVTSVLMRADLEMPLAISLYYQGLVAVMGYELSRDVLGESQFVRESPASEDGYIGSSLDITDRRASEDALRESQERYTLATAAGAVGVWDWNLATQDVYVDPTLKSILGFEDGEITNRADDWGSRVHAEDAAAVRAHAQACIDGRIPEYEIEHRMTHKDRSVRWFLSRGTVLRGADGTAQRIVGTKVDITERKRAEEVIREKEAVLRVSDQELRDLAGRLIAAQEVERSRIARDLHDDTSQQLAGLAIALSGLKHRMGASPDVEDLRRDVDSLQQRTIALAANLRHVSHDLHPSVLEHSGLVAALAAYCTEVQHQQAVAVTFSAEGDFASTDADVALCLYRITQEALRNVVAHADARRADVRLRRLDDSAELTIADDGKGFDVIGARAGGKGLGLVSINERVRLAGGTVTIATEVNKGTRVRVQVPTRHASSGVDESRRYATFA